MRCVLCGQGIPPPECHCSACGASLFQMGVAWFLSKKIQFSLGAKILEVYPDSYPSIFFPLVGDSKFTAVNLHRPPQSNPHRLLTMDVRKLTFSDQSFDLILCNFVFPYIRSDYQAMWQVHRCLKPHGLAILNVELEGAKTKRASSDSNIEGSPHSGGMREWIYGEDYFERLEAAGFFAHRLSLKPMAGLEVDLHLCFKFKDVMESFLKTL